ncbi:MAG: hypothetical protein P8047_16010 [Gammaproteobacteria bacterium]
MDIRETDFYYFTLDLDYKDVMPCKYVKQIETVNGVTGREALIVKFTEPHPLKTKYLLIFPRWKNESFFNVAGTEIAGAYVFDGTPYIDKDVVDEKELMGKYIDIGALTPSLTTAIKWKN